MADHIAEISKMVWQPIETAPKDGTEVLLLFHREFEMHGDIYPRVRAASWVGDWSIPYRMTNPPHAWASLAATQELPHG